MSFLQRIFGGDQRRRSLEPLYRAVVAAGRDPGWYREGGIPDTIDGRFDMVAAMMALTLLRLEKEGEAAREPSVLLTETFVDDMDATLRQLGVGDYVVGKHVGRMMGALGGRLAAFRAAAEDGTGFAGPVRRNIFHESPPNEAAVLWVAERLERFDRALAARPLTDLLEARLPVP
ncbi:MAG TPA: ubiquinol-cytochrome C chaperone family protein [Allosphingosinicella sp.]|nr:ubiquinol-cytochrome C chaperone family protein [Allosphingosinicella sp.]